MKLTVIGCSGSYPGPDSPASCYLVEADDAERTWRVLLDLGSGALGTLHRYVDPLAVDAVVISHLHPDHWFDMSGYYVLRKYHPSGAQPRIPVYAPAGAAERMALAYGLPAHPGMSAEFDFHTHDENTTVRVGPLSIAVTKVVHPVDAFAIRVACEDRSFVYSGDTAAAEALVRLAKGSSLLLAEASFREGEANPPDLHMTGKEAAEVAREAGVETLVLTHVPPWHEPQDAFDEARPVFDGNLELARTGAVYEI
ncbi:MAG TPA: MBL fold metallo-hydrolase [Nocardioidaceae bacterium]|nr:MBL fold metallo-hydrolase [Nocardioidaceae bacterium]